ncbi:CvpA family protein [Neobacillus sp. YIM B06451]|uniref:CvpA family protein n=1 Tax=Neobacillus sp. YIM B06451 TaxID=3070994 RepID=UPI00292FF064|nr:CvpA family protein [Neobacillus sp. YIM B06451]
MLDLALIIIFIFGFLIGLKRGFILQLFHLAGFVGAYIVAYLYYDSLAPKLKLWIPYPTLGDSSPLSLFASSNGMEEAYYRAFAFIAIFIAVKVLVQIIGSMLDFIAHLPILRTLNVWAGGLLGVAEVYLIVLLLLYIAALVPMDAIQKPLEESAIAEAIIKHTPIISQQLKELWIEYVAA